MSNLLGLLIFIDIWVNFYVITKSNPLTRKTAHKRLNINHFKERLVHFNGTVVKLENNH